MMKQCFLLKNGEWEEHKSIFKVEAKATEWALERTREALESGRRGGRKIEHRAKNHVEEYGIIAALIAPAGGLCAQIATVFPWKSTSGGFQLARSTAVGGAHSVEKRLESAQQAAGGANRQQCQLGQ